MDNLTHTLFALTLTRTPLGRGGRGSMSALILASNAPDIDVVTTAGGALRYLQWHRGPTHGLMGVIGLGLVTAGLVWAGGRVLDPERAAQGASYRTLALVSIIGVLLHVLMDLPTPYGSRILSPFDWRWYSLDLIPIVDVYLLVALGAGLALGARSEAAGRRSAAIVLAFMMANYAVRGAAHERALTLAPRVFDPLLPERCDPSAPSRTMIDMWPRSPLPSAERSPARPCLIEIAALPSFSTPFHWRLIAQLSDAYESRDINVLDGRLRGPRANVEAMGRSAVRSPNRWTPPVFAAAGTEVGRIFLGFSRFPAARAFVNPDGTTTVRWTEMRFTGGLVPSGVEGPVPSGVEGPTAGDQRDRRSDFFSATVRVDVNGGILEQRLGP